MMEFLGGDQPGERARIHWLIQLRWVAVFGVLAVTSVTGTLLQVIPNPWPLYALVGALGAWNVCLAIGHRRGRRVQAATSQVVIDLLVLAGLLFFSGGLENPFAIFLAVQVIVGSILLPRSTAFGIAGLAGALTLGLTICDVLDLVPPVPFLGQETNDPDGFGNAPWGIALALQITMGVTVHFVTTIMDDLRERAAEAVQYHEEAERERRKLLDVVRSVGAAMVLLDADFEVEWCNRRALKVLGEDAWRRPFKLDEEHAWPDREALEAGRNVVHDWEGPDDQGRPRRYQMSASPVLDPTGHLEQVILLFVDVTDLRAAEQQLVRTEKLAALGRLAAGVAHEIATPLGSVSILNTELEEALDDALAGSVERRREIVDYLADIKNETRRMTALVRRLLDLSHPEGQESRPVDLRSIAQEAVRLISVRGREHKDRIVLDIPEDVARVESSPDRLLQVLLNLLDNALDACPPERGGIRLVAEDCGEGVCVEIRDAGEGISPEHLARVFDPFFTTKEVGQGTGLGLYVSYEIVKNLGGDITIESEVGVGTTVRLTLPKSALAPVAQDHEALDYEAPNHDETHER